MIGLAAARTLDRSATARAMKPLSIESGARVFRKPVCVKWSDQTGVTPPAQAQRRPSQRPASESDRHTTR